MERVGPPPLPSKEQKEFEELLKRVNTPLAASTEAGPTSSYEAKTDGQQEYHPDIRRGAPPEFSGDKNPKTGEVGGPKSEPIRWKGGDWSYGGRATDF